MPVRSDVSLALALRSGPFHEALREAIAGRGLTLRSLQRRLADLGAHVSVGTLSYWQSGRRVPQRGSSRSAVSGLEQVLELPPGSLAALLAADSSGRRDRPRPLGGPLRWEELTPSATAMRELLAQFGAGIQNRLLVASQHEELRIGARRELLCCGNTLTVVARERVDRYLFTYEADPGSDVGAVAVMADENCRLGRVRTDPQAGLLAAELLFDRQLLPGETHLFRYSYVDRNPIEWCNVSRSLRYGADVYALSVSFDPAALPVRSFRYDITNRARPEQHGTELFLGVHHMIHTVERAAAPGIYGIAWTWA